MQTFTTKRQYAPKITKAGKTVTRSVDTMTAKSLTHEVTDCGDGDYLVKSQSGNTYEVTVTETDKITVGGTRNDFHCTCTCDYAQFQSGPSVTCSHTIAAVRTHLGRTIKLADSPTDARRPHRPVHYIGDGVWATRR